MINAAQSGHPNLDQMVAPVTAESRSIAADRVSLLATIARWERRRRLSASAIGVPRGALIGLILAAAIAGLARIQPWLLPSQLIPLILAVILGSMLLSAFVIWLWPRSFTAAARIFDRRFAASERLSTAFELADPARQSAGQFAALQVRDARRYAEGIDVRARLPIRFERRALVIGFILAVIVALLVVLPNPQTALITNQNVIQAAINQQIQGLTQIAHDAQANAALTDSQKAAINQTAQDAIKQLSQPGVGQTEATAILSAAAQKFQDTPAQMNTPLQTAEQQAGTALTAGGQTSSPALAPGIEQLGASLQQGNLTAAVSAAQALSQTLGAQQANQPTVSAGPTSPAIAATASATLSAIPQSATPAVTALVSPNAGDPAAANAFNQAANALQAADPQTAKAFQDAAKALQNGDLGTAQKSLAQAGKSLQAQQQQQSQSPLSQAAQKAAQQAASGAQQVAQSGGDQPSSSNTLGQPPQGQQPSNGAQNGAPSSNPSGGGQPNNGQSGPGQSSSATEPSGGQPGQPAPAGNNGKSGGVQTGSGSTGSVDPNGPQLINSSGQPSGGSSQGGGSAGGQPSAGNGAGGAGNDVTNGTGSATKPPGTTITTNNGQGAGGVTTTEHVYAPSFVGGSSGQALVIPNAPNNDPNAPLTNQNNAPPTPQANASVPLDTVIGAAVTQSDLAMDEAHVPISLRGVIHDYFSGLQNAASQAASPAQPNPSATSQPGSP